MQFHTFARLELVILALSLGTRWSARQSIRSLNLLSSSCSVIRLSIRVRVARPTQFSDSFLTSEKKRARL